MSNPNFLIPTFGEVEFKLNLEGFEDDNLLSIYKDLVLIRLFERKCAFGKEKGLIGGPVHLAVGQEAIPVGISVSLNKSDYVYSAHRSHAHLLALGSDPYRVFAEILGKSSGLSGGFGGSMHLVDKSVGFEGSVPIVSGTVPLALGSAFASKYRKDNSVAIAYFGDGAVEEGVVHECFNMASLIRLPIIFVCENNYMASHMHLSERQTSSDLTRFAKSNNIKNVRLDGNDPIGIAREFRTIIGNCRSDNEPYFVELLTYRQLGHVDWREDIDVGVTRSKSEIDKWKKFDPLIRFEESLIEQGLLSDTLRDKIYAEIRSIVDSAFEKAINDEEPKPSKLLEVVLSNKAGS